MAFSFSVEKKRHEASKASRARAGTIYTPHGDIQTPAFIAVGTKATVKALTPEMLRDIGVQAVLANTYHLYLQPGQEVIRAAGGFAPFMNWKGPTMTDSGGFQVFSLGAAFDRNVSKIGDVKGKRGEGLLMPEGIAEADEAEHEGGAPKRRPVPRARESDPSLDSSSPHASLAKIDENGVAFTSILDGSAHYFTPEKSIQIQHDLGADIIVAFDECTAPDETHEYQREAMDRTHRWAARSLAEHKKLAEQDKKGQALYGVVQGGRFEDLRKESAHVIAAMDFDGFCIGGSFDKDDIYKAVEWVTDLLPEEKPRHLLGMGEVIDLFEGVERGIDTFDCVSPTRLARNGALYTKNGRINIMNAEYMKDFSPIDPGCGCPACTNYSRAYISHLFRAREILASILATQHNLYFLVNLVKEMRARILDGTFPQFKADFLAKYYAKV